MSTELSHAISNDALTTSLKQDADKINTLHRAIVGSVESAIMIGQILTEIKNEVLQHGQWLPWVEANLEFTNQTAGNYMRVFENRDKLQSKGTLSLSAAYKLLAGTGQRTLKPDKPVPTEPQQAPATGIPLVFEEAGTEGIEHTYVPPSSIPSLEEAVAKYFENFLQAFPASELPNAVMLLRSLADQFQHSTE